MFCTRCGNKVEDNVKFCTKCGAKIQRGDDTLQIKSEPQKKFDNNKAGGEKSKKEKKKKGLKGIIIFILILFFVALLGVGGWYVYNLIESREETDLEVIDEEDSEDEISGKEEKRKKKKEEELSEQAEKESESIEATEEEITEESNKESEESENTVVIEEQLEDTAIHTYQIVKADVTWTEAFERAKAAGGYLVRINTPEEMRVIEEQIEKEGQKNGIFWLGGIRAIEDSRYFWVNENWELIGEELNGTEFWLDGEPSLRDETVSVDENYMNMFYMKSAGGFIWNDTVDNLLEIAPSYEGKIGYIIEFEN